MSKVNTSDRKIVDTGRGLVSNPDYRLPEVQVVGTGYEVVPDNNREDPDDRSDSPQEDIGVPRNIEIESQEIRVQPDGSAVVDVTLSFETADGAEKHEMRISKL